MKCRRQFRAGSRSLHDEIDGGIFGHIAMRTEARLRVEQGAAFVRDSGFALGAGAQYCSGACRVAAHRKRHQPPPDTSATPAGAASRAAAYARVTEILGTLRKDSRLGWHMVLDLTRELDEWQTYGSPREARAALRRRYDEDRWLGQPYYPISVVEKDTLEPVAKPIASDWQMPFASSRGYGSGRPRSSTSSPISTPAGSIFSAPGSKQWVTSASGIAGSSASD